jgi:RNA polymerase sigma factor (sigma-70 family)
VETSPSDSTRQLLVRWHAGDAAALDELLARNLEWIHDFVRARMGDLLRAREETRDLVQDGLLEFLRYGPRFLLDNEVHLRGLLGKIALNVVRDRHAWFTRRRRDARREEALADSRSVELDPRVRTATRPDRAAEREESRQMIRIALELLPPLDREVVQRRHFDGQAFAEIAAAIGGTPDGVRKRFDRALPKLLDTVRRLERGQLDTVLAEDPP